MTEWVVAAGRNVGVIAVEFIREYMRKYREMNARWYDYVFGGGKKGSILLHMRSGLLVEDRYPRLSLRTALTFFPIGEVATLCAASIAFGVVSVPLVLAVIIEDVRWCISAMLAQWAVLMYCYAHIKHAALTTGPSAYEYEFVSGLSGAQASVAEELPTSLPDWWKQHVEDVVFWQSCRKTLRRTIAISMGVQTLVWVLDMYLNANGGN